MQQVVITNLNRPEIAPVRADYCVSFWSRLKGLMFHPPLTIQEGLLLVYPRDNRTDTSIHMMFVATDLSVVWINRENIVVDVILAKKGQLGIFPQKPASFVLEMAPERLNDFKIGDKIQITS